MKTSRADLLPDCLVNIILSYLSYGEAARMSSISKTWLQAWLTHSRLKFRVNSDDNMKKVDKIMERYRDTKIPIHKFEFSNCSRLLPLIDKWLVIALQNGVQELVLRGSDLKPVALSTTGHVASSYYLTKLSLSFVSLDENMLQTLLNICPLIVSFKFEKCIGLEKIELLNLQKIRSVSIRTKKNQRVIIQAPTLEHLYYSGDEESPKLEIVECQNLKFIELSCMKISDGFLQHLFSRCQSLESLSLDRVYAMLENFNICTSPSLRVLKIFYCKGIGDIDAPNLVSIEYMGDEIPELKISAKEPSQLKRSKIIIESWNKINDSWFCKLRKFLSNSASWSQISLYFSKYNEINSEGMQLHHRVATHQVDALDVTILEPYRKCPTFEDALLWSCNPRILNLRSSSTGMVTCLMDLL